MVKVRKLKSGEFVVRLTAEEMDQISRLIGKVRGFGDCLSPLFKEIFRHRIDGSGDWESDVIEWCRGGD